MANISCPVFVPCPDSPILNLSAEDPDVFYWPGYFYPQPCRQILCPPPFYSKDCFGVVYSATSQAEADSLAQQASVTCQDRGVSCTNEAQTATVTCANGTPVSFTCPAGTFNVSIMGTLAACQAAANAQALAYAQQQASLLAQSACSQTHCSFTTGATLPDGVVGTSYVKQLVVSISGIPVGFFVVSGSLPPGLTLNSSGTITGVPTTSGTYQFSVRASSPATSCTKQFQITVSLSLYACYKCDEPSGATALVDSISGFNMSVSGGSLVSGPGKLGTSVKFGWNFPSAKSVYTNPAVGTNSHWDLSSGSFTVRFWLNLSPDPLAINNWKFFSIEALSGFDLYYGISDGKIHYEIELGGVWQEVAASLGAAGWHRVIVWHEKGSGIGIKIDDGAAVTLANANSQSSENRGIGFFTDSNGGASYGYMDDIAVWKRKLTDVEMMTDWNSGSGQSCAPACYGSIPLSPTLTLDAALLAAINADIPDPHFTGTFTLIPSPFGCIEYSMGDPLSGFNAGFIDDYSVPATFLMNIMWGWNGFVFTRGLEAVKVPSSKTVPAGTYQIVFLTPNPLAGYSIGSLITVT